MGHSDGFWMYWNGELNVLADSAWVEEKERVKNDSKMLVLSNCHVGVSLTEKRQTAGEADLGARIRSLD